MGAREMKDPTVRPVFSPPQCCATLTPAPLRRSRPRCRSEPQQPATKTLTHRLPRREWWGGENMLNLMRKSVPCEEETFIHVFCLFSKTNRGRYYAATLITLLSFTVKFQIRGFSLLTFMVISKPACCLPSPPSSKMRLLGLLHKLQIGGNEIISWSPELHILRVVLTCGAVMGR